AVPSSYSAPLISVYLARYDADNADGDNDPLTGGDSGLLWVKVTYAGRPGGLETVTGP
ncbi:MAG: hypothetical protein HY900_32915, partial [Deltaproteobacteria bacterium]|nr:hypothetical protein [Deltaproteobacteria bacterium]